MSTISIATAADELDKTVAELEAAFVDLGYIVSDNIGEAMFAMLRDYFSDHEPVEVEPHQPVDVPAATTAVEQGTPLGTVATCKLVQP